MNIAISTAVKKAGGARPLAAFLDVSHQAVYQWIERGWFPLTRARQISRRYRVPVRKLVNPEIAKLLAA